MDQTERLAQIVALIEQESVCKVGDLAGRFGVSEETIRRDIRQLEATGRAVKVHGAVRGPSNVFESPYFTRVNEQRDAKRAIGIRAAELVEDGMTLLIDSGTTCLWLARALSRIRHLTVVTNALEVAREINGQGTNARVFLAGGELSHDYVSTFGPEAEAFLGQFTPEIAFYGIGAIDPRAGFLDFHLPEAALKRALAPLADRNVVLADSGKYARKGLIRTFGFDEVHACVVDAPPPEEVRAASPGVEWICL